MSEEILRVEDLTKYYTSGFISTEKTVGCEDVSFSIEKGEVFSLVGESGSGKSTVAKMVQGQIEPTRGDIFVDGKKKKDYNNKVYLSKVQSIFQDPYSTFNKYYTVDRPLREAFNLIEEVTGESYSDEEKEEIIRSKISKTGMNPEELLGRYPHQVSGGQMQRMLIARALIIDPDVLLADEATSMIDASTRVSVLNELLRLKETEDMSVIFITHDVGQAYYIAERAAVMKEGHLVEVGPCEEVFFSPEHPYTQDLVDSVPKVHEKWDL